MTPCCMRLKPSVINHCIRIVFYFLSWVKSQQRFINSHSDLMAGGFLMSRFFILVTVVGKVR